MKYEYLSKLDELSEIRNTVKSYISTIEEVLGALKNPKKEFAFAGLEINPQSPVRVGIKTPTFTMHKDRWPTPRDLDDALIVYQGTFKEVHALWAKLKASNDVDGLSAPPSA